MVVNVQKLLRTIFVTISKVLKENEQFTHGVNDNDLFNLTSIYYVPTVCRANLK